MLILVGLVGAAVAGCKSTDDIYGGGAGAAGDAAGGAAAGESGATNAPGCPADESRACTELVPGALVGPEMCGSARSRMVAQTALDFVAEVRDVVADITQLCRNIAIGIGIGSAEADRLRADAVTDLTKKMEAWCTETRKTTVALTARGGFTLGIGPGLTVIAVADKLKCQESCSPAAPCDAKVTKPLCVNGSLQISCSGVCSARARLPLNCIGKCKGACLGECVAPAGVLCEGKCTGACTDANGVDATDPNGECYATCKGTCSLPRPGVECPGECRAEECKGTCEGTPAAPVLCDGECNGDYQYRTCTVGGSGDLVGGCAVDRNCESLCRIRARATASFPPPSMLIRFNSPSPDSERIIATFRANVPQLYAIQQRLDGLYNTSYDAPINDLVANLKDIRWKCKAPLYVQTNEAFEQIQATIAPVSGAIIPLEVYYQPP